MIQRIQSLYLFAICMLIMAFMRASIWTKIDCHDAMVCRLQSYALVLATGKYILWPYGVPCLIALSIMGLALYAIIRHDNRKVQLHIMAGINLALVILMIFVFVLAETANNAYMGVACYQAGMIFPCLSFIASLLARYHIRRDEQLVNANHLR